MNDNIKEILKLAASLVLTRTSDVCTGNGSCATVSIDLINKIDEALAHEFTEDSEDINFENIEDVIVKIKDY